MPQFAVLANKSKESTTTTTTATGTWQATVKNANWIAIRADLPHCPTAHCPLPIDQTPGPKVAPTETETGTGTEKHLWAPILVQNVFARQRQTSTSTSTSAATLASAWRQQ